MALETQTIPISLAQGLDTKTDDKQVIPGKLLEAENCVFTRTGRLQKRFGHAALSMNAIGGGIVSGGVALGVFSDEAFAEQQELLMFTGTQVLSYSPAIEQWANRGNAVSIINDSHPIITNSYQQLNPDSSFSGAMECYCWEDSRGGVRYSIFDSTTSTFLSTDQAISPSDGYCKTIGFGDRFVILYTSTSLLRYVLVNPNNPTVQGSTAVLANDINAQCNYDATVVGNRLFVSYYTSDGYIATKYLDTNFASTACTSVVGSASNSIGMWSDPSENVWIAYHDGTSLKYHILSYSGALSLVSSPIESISTTINRITGIFDTGVTSNIYYEVNAANAYDHYIKTCSITNGASVGAISTFKKSVGLSAKAVKINTIVYLLCAHESTFQSTYFLIDANRNIVAKENAQIGGGLRTKCLLAEFNLIADGHYMHANSIKGRLETESGYVFSLLGVSRAHLDFTNSHRFQSTTLKNNFLYVGGVLSSYDSNAITENNFLLYPENITAVSSNSGGSIAYGYSYQYSVVYEWTDNFGQIHRSTTSIPVTVVLGSPNNTITLTIPTLHLTNKSAVRIVIYRTLGNGEIFYRVTSIVNPLLNDTSVNTVSFVDTASDATISSNEFIYTFGDVLDNDCPPPCSLITSYKDRVWLSGTDNKKDLWFSKRIQIGEPVNFSQVFTVRTDARGGDITAIHPMDDKLIIFKESAIYVLSGDGPTDIGSGSDYGDPQLITSDVGCSTPNSVVMVPDGLMFMSAKGIYLLNRSLSASYIGAPVETYNDRTISSAILVAAEQQVRFTTEEDVILVYDYLHQQWSVFTGITATDSDMWNGHCILLKTTGKVLQENSDSFLDESNYIPMKLTTSWLSFAGIQNFQRVRRLIVLGEFKGPHTLEIEFWYDFAIAPEQTASIDASADAYTYGVGTYGTGPFGGLFVPYQFRVHLSKQKCTTIKMTIRDVQSSAYNEGFNISNISFEVGAKKGHHKLPAGQSYGAA